MSKPISKKLTEDEEENELSETEPSDEEKTLNVNLGRYFDNTTRTIFDDIVSSHKNSFFDTSLTVEKDVLNKMNEKSPNDNNNNNSRDAWISSEQTRKVLRAIATNSTGAISSSHNTNSVDIENITMPGLTLQEELVDPVRKAVIQFMGEEEVLQRNVLTISGVTHDERGLRELIQAGCFRAAVNLTGRLIPLYGQGYGKMNHPSKHSPKSLQLWFTRLALLAKLRLNDTLEIESKPFGNLDKPDMYFIFYPEMYGTRPGSMASFAFRLFLAEVPSFCGKPKKALDNLYKILGIVRQIIKNLKAGLTEEGNPKPGRSSKQEQNSLKLWTRRRSWTLISIANCALTMKNYVLATELLEQLYESLESQKKKAKLQQLVVSAIGRLHLSLGDVSAAEERFAEVRRLISDGNASKEKEEEEEDEEEEDDEISSLNGHLEVSSRFRENVDRGLTAIAQNAFQEALDSFSAALKVDSTNIMLINNVAVCLLYTGKLEAAIHLIENAITRNPARALQDNLLLNISTLYELHTTHSKQSKLDLLKQLSRYRGDATDVQCLKLVN